MQVRLFIQRMQVTVLERCCGDGMSCHVHAEAQSWKQTMRQDSA